MENIMFENNLIIVGIMIPLLVVVLGLYLEYHSNIFIGKKKFSINIVSNYFDPYTQKTVYAFKLENTGAEVIRAEDFYEPIQIFFYSYNSQFQPEIHFVGVTQNKPSDFRIYISHPYSNVAQVQPTLFNPGDFIVLEFSLNISCLVGSNVRIAGASKIDKQFLRSKAEYEGMINNALRTLLGGLIISSLIIFSMLQGIFIEYKNIFLFFLALFTGYMFLKVFYLSIKYSRAY